MPDKPGLAFKIFSKLAAKKVNVDIILQSVGRDDTKDITFTVPAEYAERSNWTAVEEYAQVIGATEGCSSMRTFAKVSIVGAGMETHPGVAAEMFEALFEANINIQMISTSEIKVSVLLAREDADNAVAAIHAKFFGTND